MSPESRVTNINVSLSQTCDVIRVVSTFVLVVVVVMLLTVARIVCVHFYLILRVD